MTPVEKAKTRYSTKFAFILRSEQISKLVRLVENEVSKPSITAQCSDGVVRSFSDADSLLKYSNLPSRCIQSLRLSAETEDWSKRIDLSFANDVFGTIDLSVSGPEADVVRLRHEIAELVGATRAWYSWITRANLPFVVMWVCIPVFLLLGEYSKTIEQPAPEPPDFGRVVLRVAILFVALGLLIAITYGLNVLKKRFFPSNTFVIGHEQQRFDVHEKIRWTIVVGFAVSVLASMIVSIL